MKQLIRLKVNREESDVMVEPWWTLLKVLRDELHLTGAKVGCEEGDCGSCTVLIDDKAVKSCIYPVMKARGKSILTIEGLIGPDRQLHAMQQAFIDYFAVQCGYCSPGMILTAVSLLNENPEATEADIKAALVGNLCRCTGYTKIIEAVMAARGKF